jgi:hypothetical protein
MKNPMVVIPPATRAFQLLALALLAAIPGFADILSITVKQSFSCSAQTGCSGGGSGVLLLPQFNPNLGILTGVDFRSSLADNVTFTATNTSSNQTGTLAGYEDSNAQLTILTDKVLVSDEIQHFGAVLQPLQTYMGSSSCSSGGCGSVGGRSFSPPGSDPFVGNGFLDIPFTLSFGASRGNFSDIYVSLDQITVTTALEADVQYFFAPVPEPSTWLLLAAPVLILIGRWKRNTV